MTLEKNVVIVLIIATIVISVIGTWTLLETIQQLPAGQGVESNAAQSSMSLQVTSIGNVSSQQQPPETKSSESESTVKFNVEPPAK